MDIEKKRVKAPLKKAIKLDFKKYPEFLKVLVNRPSFYNEQLELVEKLEKEGKIFVLRPEMKVVRSLETQEKKLTNFYLHGYKIMNRDFKALKDYLNS